MKLMSVISTLIILALLFYLFMINSSGHNKTEIRDELKEFEKASFAGGCFWCIESAFAEFDGVKLAISGYMGGESENPSYEDVSSGNSGHIEIVQLFFDPEEISYEALVDHYFRQIDPTDDAGQFADRGSQYKPVIFYHNNEQKAIVEDHIKMLDSEKIFDKAIKVTVEPASEFYPAEEYHQDYYKKNSLHYQIYKNGSGRTAFIDSVWKKIPKDRTCKLRFRP